MRRECNMVVAFDACCRALRHYREMTSFYDMHQLRFESLWKTRLRPEESSGAKKWIPHGWRTSVDEIQVIAGFLCKAIIFITASVSRQETVIAASQLHL
ncbi:hypothetical protein BaRGS_00034664 [Batillaria attramentaria]|uniref:Uncharacterized protein n=1 Tax=Batillaria attramentaria TaxID=370345 RepID=A0ABD0JGS6_9CAEN